MDPSSIAIMHVIAQLRLGAGRYVVDTAIEQAHGLGHSVTVCVSADVDEHWRTDPKLVSELADRNIEVRQVGDFFHRQTGLLQDASARLREMRKGTTGKVVVHAHTAMAAAAGHWAQPDGLIATCHGWGTGRSNDIDLQDALAYRLCDSVATYSRYWAERLTSDLAVDCPQIIPMGLNLQRFPSFPKRTKTLSAPVRIVTVCELIPRKGVDLLLHAMPTMWNDLPGTELHIMGHGPAAADLQVLATELDHGLRRVFFHGAVPNPYQFLADYDLFVLASRSDNLPVVLLEAMLAGLPIVATDVGGAADLISAAACGKFVPPNSSESLARALLSIVHQGEWKMASLGHKGERFSRRQYDVRKTAAKLEPLYRDALRRGSRKRRR